jgi:hypothetical protein
MVEFGVEVQEGSIAVAEGLWARSGTGVTARPRGKPMGLALEGLRADLTLPQPTSEGNLVRVTHR